MSLVERSLYLLQNTRFFTLASRSLVGDVWASTVSYVAAFEPIRIIWCSTAYLSIRRISVNMLRLAGQYFVLICKGFSSRFDGAQFVGFCHEVPESESVEVYSYFPQLNSQMKHYV